MEKSSKSRGALEVVIQSGVGGGNRSGKEKKSPHLIGFSREGRFHCRAREYIVTAETGVEENGGAAFLLHLRTGRPFTSPQPRASQTDPSQGSPKNAHSKSLMR